MENVSVSQSGSSYAGDVVSSHNAQALPHTTQPAAQPQKFIVVTGVRFSSSLWFLCDVCCVRCLVFQKQGTLSGVGKGTTISCIGVVLKSMGFCVTAIKIDPYLVMPDFCGCRLLCYICVENRMSTQAPCHLTSTAKYTF